MLDYAVYLGIDTEHDTELLWIAERAMTAACPEGSYQLYGLCEEMVRAHENRPALSAEASERVAALFTRMDLVAPRFETSLQRGSILYGFVKVRKLKHQTIATMLQYLWTKVYPSFLCCGSPATGRRTPGAGTCST